MADRCQPARRQPFPQLFRKQYEFRENDLTDAGETWSWYFTEDAAALLKEAMARLGVRDPVSWASWALNQWVGKPEGFVRTKDGKYR